MKTGAHPLLIQSETDPIDVRVMYFKPQHIGDAPSVVLQAVPLSILLTDRELGSVCETFGEVQHLERHSSQTSAVVVFKEQAAIQKLLKVSKRQHVIVVAASDTHAHRESQPYGLKAAIQQHKKHTPGNDALLQQVNAWLEEWVAAEKRREEEAAAKLEAGGWTIVQRSGKGGRKKSKDASGAGIGAVGARQALHVYERVQKSNKVPADFYRFQQRERKRSKLLELQEKFAQDRKKVAELKRGRKFKPV